MILGINEVRWMLQNETLAKLLVCLISHPFMFSLIEQHYADELEERGLFSLETFEVTALGRDLLSTITIE